jgi:Holliday junction resolvase RusA-like endonuclease
MTALEIFIPGKPMGKARPDQSKFGRRFAEPKTAAKEREIAQLAMVGLVGRKRFSGAIAVSIDARMPGKATAKPDSDNIAKLILDALNKVAWDDDAAVTDLRVKKRHAPEPGILVRVEAA